MTENEKLIPLKFERAVIDANLTIYEKGELQKSQFRIEIPPPGLDCVYCQWHLGHRSVTAQLEELVEQELVP